MTPSAFIEFCYLCGCAKDVDVAGETRVAVEAICKHHSSASQCKFDAVASRQTAAVACRFSSVASRRKLLWQNCRRKKENGNVREEKRKQVKLLMAAAPREAIRVDVMCCLYGNLWMFQATHTHTQHPQNIRINNIRDHFTVIIISPILLLLLLLCGVVIDDDMLVVVVVVYV